MRDKLITIIKSALSGWVLSHLADKVAVRVADALIGSGVVEDN